MLWYDKKSDTLKAVEFSIMGLKEFEILYS